MGELQGKETIPREQLTFSKLSEFFYEPLRKTSTRLNICVTALKRICRRNGIPKWPYRSLVRYEKRIVELTEKNQKTPDPKYEKKTAHYQQMIRSLITEPQRGDCSPKTDYPEGLTFVEWQPDHPKSLNEFILQVEQPTKVEVRETKTLPTLEPDLQMHATKYGLIQGWMIPSVAHA